MPERILLIDDDLRIAAALKVRLEAAGFDVLSAFDGRSGLAAAEEHRPDLIVLDMRMPGMSGLEVCRAIKSQPDLRHIPVVFLTANTREKAKESAFAAGAAGFVSKPYEAAEVLAAIRAALAHDDENSGRDESGRGEAA